MARQADLGTRNTIRAGMALVCAVAFSTGAFSQGFEMDYSGFFQRRGLSSKLINPRWVDQWAETRCRDLTRTKGYQYTGYRIISDDLHIAYCGNVLTRKPCRYEGKVKVRCSGRSAASNTYTPRQTWESEGGVNLKAKNCRKVSGIAGFVTVCD